MSRCVLLSVLVLSALLLAGCARRPTAARTTAPQASAPQAMAPAYRAPASRPAPTTYAPAPSRPAAPRQAGTASKVHVNAGGSFTNLNVPYDDVVARARTRGRPAILYFCASWCGCCSTMNSQTLTDRGVQQRLRDFETALYDPNTDAGRAVADRFDIWAYPTMVVLDGSGRELQRIKGASDPQRFLQQLSTY